VFQVNLKRVQSPVRAGTLFICVVFGACLPEREFTNKLITTRGNARNGADTYFWCIWAPVKDELNLELTLEEIGGLHLKLPLPYCLFRPSEMPCHRAITRQSMTAFAGLQHGRTRAPAESIHWV
jgi:hypothetical protein